MHDGPRIMVVGDASLADELLLLVESRGGSVGAAPDPAGLLELLDGAPPRVVVVAEAAGALAAAECARALDERYGPSAPRVLLVGERDATGQDVDWLVAPRADCFATCGALLRLDPEARVRVQILARWSRLDGADDKKRLGNVLELGLGSLLFDPDEALPEQARLRISFVVPGTTCKVELRGAPDPHAGTSGPRLLLLDDVDRDARRALRGFLEKRLVRTPAEVV